MNKTKKHKHSILIHKNKNKYKPNHSKRNTTRPPKKINTNTRKQKGGKKWSISSIWNLALDTKLKNYSSLKDEQAERNEWLRYLISDDWLKEYKNAIPIINEYKNKHNQMWARVLISEKSEEFSNQIIDLDKDRQFIKKVGDYFSDTFVKPLQDKNNITLVLEDPNVLTKMCKQIMYEPANNKEQNDCKPIIEELIQKNFDILQLEIVYSGKVLQTIFLEQDKEFELWIEEEKERQKEQEIRKKQQSDEIDKVISDDLIKEIANQNWKQSLQKFKEFRRRKAKIDFKPENLKLEQDVLAFSSQMKEIFKNFKIKYPNYISYNNLANILTKLNLTIEMYTNFIKEDEVFWRDPALIYYESTKKIYLGNIKVCLEEFSTIMADIINGNNYTIYQTELKETLQKFSKEVKDKLDADLKYNTKQIQLTNLIKDLTFLSTQTEYNKKLIETYSSETNKQIYKKIINEINLNIALELYTNYLRDIKNRQEIKTELDNRIEKNQKDVIQIYYIISDAQKKEEIAAADIKAKVNQQEVDLLKIKEKILEEIIKRKINLPISIEEVSVKLEEDPSSLTVDEDEPSSNLSRQESISSLGTNIGSSVKSQGSTQESINSLKSQESQESLQSLISIKKELLNTNPPNRNRINEIKNKLNKIGKLLKSGSSGTESRYKNLFSKLKLSSDHNELDELDEITNVINSSSLSPPPHQTPTKLTSISQTMGKILSFLKKSESIESNPLYSESIDNPILLKEIQEGVIEKQDIKMKQIAKLEHNLRQINSELSVTHEKYKNKQMRDLFEEELLKQKETIENDLNIAMRDLDNLNQKGKIISNNSDILGKVKERNEIVTKKHEDEKRLNEEGRKMIEKKHTTTAYLINKIAKNSPDKYDKNVMIERIDNLIKYTPSKTAKDILLETKQIINGEKVDNEEFRKKIGKISFQDSIVRIPNVSVAKPLEPQVKTTATSTTAASTTTKLNWKSLNDPITNYLNTISKSTIGNLEPIIKYNEDIINFKRRQIIEEEEKRRLKEDSDKRIRDAEKKRAINLSKSAKSAKIFKKRY